jgi:NADPH-dependent ferric siderophore reductase
MTDLTSGTSTLPSIADPRAPQRVRHVLRFRVLQVQRVQHVTPHLIRVTLGGSDLDGFTSPGFDDHVKVFFPDEATGELTMPTPGPEGPLWPEGKRPAMRDYTPRAYNQAARTLEIDFAVHDAGPATDWAVQARVGQRLGIGGPRGSFIVPTAFDAHLLVGDDTALPAIARRLAELPAGAKAVVLAEVDSEADQVALESDADVRVHWVYRRGAPAGALLLPEALRALTLPAGDTYAWISCESSAAKASRAVLVGEKGWNPKWVKAAGYWRRGSAATHDKHED